MSLNNFSPNSDYMVVSTNEVASIVSRFTPDMINDSIDESFKHKFVQYSPRLVNIVQALEQNYKMAMNACPDYIAEISNERDNMYRQIIMRVCGLHETAIRPDLSTIGDAYSAAYFLYEFFIANFNLNVIQFFKNYIFKEKAIIYESLKLSTFKKDTPAYSKKLFKSGANSKLAVIHANLDYVMNCICNYDIDLATYINIAYIDQRPIANELLSLLIDNGDFFKRFVIPYYNANTGIILTEIRLALQDQAVNSSDVDIVGGI